MTTAYTHWLGDGQPFRVCRPARALQSVLQARGLTVYAYPDGAHLRADPPEDHTPFSATGWPVPSAYGIGHAIDIMPRNSASGRAENAAIARAIIAARNANRPGVAWVKYINWTDEGGVCRQERWEPDHVTRLSTDRGHIHISARSDCDDDTRADGWDPMAGTPGPVNGPTQLAEDGQLGPLTISAWQRRMHTPVDGVISRPYSQLTAAVQVYLNTRIHVGLVVDGDGIHQDGRSSKTIAALQRYLNVSMDGSLSVPTSNTVMVLQRRLNAGTF